MVGPCALWLLLLSSAFVGLSVIGLFGLLLANARSCPAAVILAAWFWFVCMMVGSIVFVVMHCCRRKAVEKEGKGKGEEERGEQKERGEMV